MNDDKQIFINNIHLNYTHDDIIKIDYFFNLLSNKYNDINNTKIYITIDNLINADDINILIYCIVYCDYGHINHSNIYELCILIDFFQDHKVMKSFNNYLNILMTTHNSNEYFNFIGSFKDSQSIHPSQPLKTYTIYIIMNIYTNYVWVSVDFKNIIKVIYVLSLKQEYLEICPQIIEKLISEKQYVNAITLHEYYCSLSESKYLSVNIYESFNQITFINTGHAFYYKSLLYDEGDDILVDQETFDSNLIKNSHGVIDKNFNFENCIISGSFITKNLLRKGSQVASNDIDIFILNNNIDTVFDVLNYLKGFADQNTIIVQKYKKIINVIFENINIQIIITKAKNGFDIINNFDFDIVKVFFQNGNVYCNSFFILSLRFMLCTTDTRLLDDQPMQKNYLTRIIKYVVHKQYFGICRELLIRIYNILSDDVDPLGELDEKIEIMHELSLRNLNKSKEKNIIGLPFKEKLNYFIEEYINISKDITNNVEKYQFPKGNKSSIIISKGLQLSTIDYNRIVILLSICYLKNYDKDYIVSLINLEMCDSEYGIILNNIIECNKCDSIDNMDKESLKVDKLFDFENIDINCNYVGDIYRYCTRAYIDVVPFMIELNIPNVIIDTIFRKKIEMDGFLYQITIKKNNIVNNDFFERISKLNAYILDKHRIKNLFSKYDYKKYHTYNVINKLYMEDKQHCYIKISDIVSDNTSGDELRTEYNFNKFNVFKEKIYSNCPIFIKSFKLINIENISAKTTLFNKIEASVSIQPKLIIHYKEKYISLKYTFIKIILNNYDV